MASETVRDRAVRISKEHALRIAMEISEEWDRFIDRCNRTTEKDIDEAERQRSRPSPSGGSR